MFETNTGELCDLVVIENRRGLHARAAAKFVRAAENFRAEITVVRDDLRVSGRSIMGLMMLAATCGTHLKLIANGEDAEAAMEHLRQLVKRRFDED
jgi:phosphocarrier protein